MFSYLNFKRIFTQTRLDGHITIREKSVLGLTEAKWCDFIVYTGKGIYIERILFDATYWQNLRTELLQYYFEHFLKFAAADFKNSAEGL